MSDLTQARNDRSRALLICAATALLAAAVYYLLPASMNELSRRTAAIFVVAAVFWATEVMPLYATSLCVIGLEVLFLSSDGGIAELLPMQSSWPMKPDGTGPVDLSVGEFFKSFASPIIMLFLGGFLISDALTKHGLDKIICTRLLQPFARKPVSLLWAVLLITAFFSMWMSNTATTAMMLAIIAPIVRDLPSSDRFHRAVILAVPFGANIGGIGTPIGTPPNAVALAALRMAGYQIGFLDWMVMAVPIMLLSLLVTGLVLGWFFPADKGTTLSLKFDERGQRKLDLMGRITLLIMVAAVVLWMTEKWHGVSEAVVALLAAAALTALRVLDRRDIDSTDWNVLILMWGGLSLGDAMKSTGLLKWLIGLPIVDSINSLPAPWSQYVLATFVVALTIVFASFMSHTAATALIVPMAMAFSPKEAGAMAILVALASSFAMAMPVSTPPNAMAFASGQFPATSMIRSGGVIGIVSVLILLIGHRAVLPLMLATQQQERLVSRRVAVLVPYTGEYAEIGKLQMRGYELAAHELNELGIAVRYFDTPMSREQVPKWMNQQVLEWKPDVILGPYHSEMAADVSPLVPADGPPLLIPSATVDALTQRPGTAIFRLAPPIQLMAMTVADYLAESSAAAAPPHIYVIAENSTYGRAAAQALTGSCLMRGLALPQAVYYDSDPLQWPAEVAAPPADAVMLMVTRDHQEAIALAQRYGPTHRVIGFAGGFATPGFRQFIASASGDAWRQVLVLSPWRNDDPGAATRQFLQHFQPDELPQYHTAQAYSAMMVAGQTVRRAHDQRVKPKQAMKGLVLGTPIGQVRFLDFGGYYQQNPAAAVIQELTPDGARTVFPRGD